MSAGAHAEKRPYRRQRITRYQPPKSRIEEYTVTTGTIVSKCTRRGQCTGATALPAWLRDDF